MKASTGRRWVIDAKVAGREVTAPSPESTFAPATDLTSALRASVEAASRNRHRTGSVSASGRVAAARPS
jgi:DNA end-binding protein Ku